MENAPDPYPSASPTASGAAQPLLHRLFWFVVGGMMSVGLNLGPFSWLKHHAGLSDTVALSISLCFVTLIFAVWNYFLNFRTRSGWKECQVRYLLAVGICYALTYSISLFGIAQFGTWPPLTGALTAWTHWPLDLVAKRLTLAIIGTAQIAVAGIKFFLYNYWVYPRHVEPTAAEEVTLAAS